MCGETRVISVTRFKKVNDRYADLFARMTACWQRVIYLVSPPAHFWRIVDSFRYDLARAQLVELAKAHGITVIDSWLLLKELRPYRKPDGHWHFAGSRQQDYGLALRWQKIVQSVQGIARYVCMPDDLRVGLASTPNRPRQKDDELQCTNQW